MMSYICPLGTPFCLTDENVIAGKPFPWLAAGAMKGGRHAARMMRDA
jgi:hypothetical protein